MTDIETRLDTYAALTLDQRAEIDAYVAQYPIWKERHTEAQALAALLDAAIESDEDRIVRHVVDEWMGIETREDIETVLRAHPHLALEADHITDHLDELASAAEDPIAKFERLTGRPLDAESVPEEGDGQALSATPLPQTVPEPRAKRRRARRLPRWIAAVVAVLGVTYGGLYAVSVASVSERTQMADLAELSAYEVPVVRSADPDDLASRLEATLDRIGDARRSTLGLFPTYDEDALAAVAADLGAITVEANAETSVSQEDRFALGRVYLQQGRDADAARVLGTLVREGSYRAPEARRLLDYIRAQDDS